MAISVESVQLKGNDKMTHLNWLQHTRDGVCVWVCWCGWQECVRVSVEGNYYSHSFYDKSCFQPEKANKCIIVKWKVRE